MVSDGVPKGGLQKGLLEKLGILSQPAWFPVLFQLIISIDTQITEENEGHEMPDAEFEGNTKHPAKMIFNCYVLLVISCKGDVDKHFEKIIFFLPTM